MLTRLVALFHPVEKEACKEAYRVWFGSYPPKRLKPIMEKPEETYWAWLPDFFLNLPLPRWVKGLEV